MLTLCTPVSVIRYSKNNGDTKRRWGNVDEINDWDFILLRGERCLHGKCRLSGSTGRTCAALVPDVSQLGCTPWVGEVTQKNPKAGSVRVLLAAYPEAFTSLSSWSKSAPRSCWDTHSFKKIPEAKRGTSDRDLTLSICWFGAGHCSHLIRQGSLQELPELHEDRSRQMNAPSLPWTSSSKECSNSSKRGCFAIGLV